MMARQKPEFYRQIIVVEGSGAFPIDMLRYDYCIPRTEMDSAQMSGDLDPTITRRVVLTRFVHKDATVAAVPQKARWASFGWIVVEERPWSF